MDETLSARKRIGLVAHDNKKRDLAEWAVYNRRLLAAHELVATGTTGTLLEEELGVGLLKLQSGPLGGDLQIGALIADGRHRPAHLLLGPARAAAARPRCQGPPAHRDGLEHPGGLQPRHG